MGKYQLRNTKARRESSSTSSELLCAKEISECPLKYVRSPTWAQFWLTRRFPWLKKSVQNTINTFQRKDIKLLKTWERTRISGISPRAIRYLSKLVSRGAKLDKGVTLYRGINVENIEDIHLDLKCPTSLSVLSNKALMYTVSLFDSEYDFKLSPQLFDDGHHVLLKIHVPASTPFLWLSHTTLAHQGEILLPTGTLEVIRKQQLEVEIYRGTADVLVLECNYTQKGV